MGRLYNEEDADHGPGRDDGARAIGILRATLSNLEAVGSSGNEHADVLLNSALQLIRAAHGLLNKGR
jgi:acid phosphatase class B